MLSAFEDAARSLGVAAQTMHGRWPDVASVAPVADVVVCHHVFFNVADAVPFATALTEHARLAVVVEIPVRHPLSGWNAAFKHFWDLDRPTGPTDADLVAVLREAGFVPEVWHSHRTPLSSHSSDPSTLLPAARRRLCLHPDRDAELAAYLADNPIDFVETVATLAVARHGDAAGVTREAVFNRRTARRPHRESSGVARVVDDRAGVQRAGHVVQGELGAHVERRRERSAVEQDARRVGDAGEPVERADREARLDEAGLAERSFDSGAPSGQVGRVEVRRGGEVEQQRAAGHSFTASECGGDVELVAER